MKEVTRDPREWGRLANVAAQSGISRPELFRAVVRGDVLGSHIRKPNATKGIWLVNLASVDAYIRSFLPGGSRYQKPTSDCKGNRKKQEVPA